MPKTKLTCILGDGGLSLYVFEKLPRRFSCAAKIESTVLVHHMQNSQVQCPAPIAGGYMRIPLLLSLSR